MNKYFRCIIGVLLATAIMACASKISLAISESAITVDDTTGDITVTGNTIDGLNITPALTFNKTNDSITYKTTLKNPDGNKFQIKEISDNNDNDYVTVTYQYDNKLSADDKDVFITLVYTSYLPFGDDLDLKNIKISIDVYEEKAEEEDDEEDEADAPDTGAATKFISGGHSSNGTTALPYIIGGITAVAIIIVIVQPKFHRVKFGPVKTFAILFVFCGLVGCKANATNSVIEININTAKIVAMPDTSDPKDVATIYFPNISNAPGYAEANPYGSNAGIVKTLDGKYVLIDAGQQSNDVKNSIISKLQELQDSSQVTIDYIAISHLDGDHYGNAVDIMNDSNVTVKNIILKHEIYDASFGPSRENVFTTITAAAAANNVNIITSGDAATEAYMQTLIGTTDYDKLSDGMTIAIGKLVKLHLFNTANVYAGKVCMNGEKLDFNAAINMTTLLQDSDGNYIYFDGSEYPNVTFHTTDTPTLKPNSQGGMDRYFYAVAAGDHNICTSNPNSIGMLLETTTTGLSHYAYFPGDMENAGTSVLASGANSAELYQDLNYVNGQFVTNITPYTILSENNTANAIYNKLSQDAISLGVSVNALLGNIDIYQEAHHGSNNNENAVWKLNLNRSDIYAIQEGPQNMATAANFRMAKTYYYTLGNVPAERKIRVGTENTYGVNCTINMIGTTTCAQV